MLLERILGSSITHAVTSASGLGSIITLTDSFAGSGYLILRHFLTKIVLDKHFDYVYVLCLQRSAKEWQRMVTSIAGPKLLSRMEKIRFLEAPTQTLASSGISDAFDFKTHLFDVRAITTQTLLPALQHDLATRDEAGGTPRAALFIDSLGPLLAHNSLPTITTWITDLIRDSMLRTLVQLVHVDSMPRSFTSTDSSSSTISIHPAPTKTLEALLSYSRSFIQCVPLPPNKFKPIPGPSTSKSAAALAAVAKSIKSINPTPSTSTTPEMLQPLIGALIFHRKSGTPKLACARELICVPLGAQTSSEATLYGMEWPIAAAAPITSTSAATPATLMGATTTGLMGSHEAVEASAHVIRQQPSTESTLRKSVQASGAGAAAVTAASTATAHSADAENEAALAKISAGLSFNVRLTAKQRAQRAAVELPYMHQGQSEVETQTYEARITDQDVRPQTLSESLVSGFADFASDGLGADLGQLGMPIISVPEGEFDDEEDFEDDEEL